MTANSNSIAHHVIQIKNEIIKHVNMNVKMIVRAKDYSWYPSSCICENGKVSKKYC